MNLTNDSKGKKTDCDCKDDKVQQGEKGPPSERSKGLVPAVPPVLKNVGNLAAGVAGMASGSATENEDHRKCKINESSANKPKIISACIEYGITNTKERKNKIQFEETLNTHRITEDKDEGKSCCSCTCEDFDEVEKSKNQKVKFQETNNMYPENCATHNNKCSAMNSYTTTKNNKTDYYTYKSSNPYPKIASNNFDRSRDDGVYSCDNKCMGIKTGISIAMKSPPVTPNNLNAFEAPKTLIQSPNLYKTEASTSGFNTSTNVLVSNNIDLFKPSNTNDNLESKNLLKFETDKPEINPTVNAPSLLNNIDLFGSSNKLDEKKTSAYAIQSAPIFPKNVDLFTMQNEQEISATRMKKLDEKVDKPKQDPIDLFKTSNIGNNPDRMLKNLPNLQEEIISISTTKSAPTFSDMVVFISNDLPDLPDLPEIRRDKKCERFYIRKRYLTANNCKCTEKDINDSSINRENCKIYTSTMLGMNACSHVGNPRNKTALQPGHSLMDWIRLSHSGQDLTGVGPRAGTLSVTPKQLAEHTTENDAWIAIRGKVYNITAYFDFHPGGKEELMKGVGQDATQMFNAVHPWVNYESILQKCLVGRLSAAEVDDDTYSLFYGRSNQTIKVPKNFRVVATPPAAINSNGELPTDNPSTDDRPTDDPLTDNLPPIKIGTPKFDWIQQLDNITTTFYIKALSNPQVKVTAPTKDNKLDVILIYNNYIHINHLHFFDNIHWPCKVIVNWDTGKIDINFRKIVPNIWADYGTLIQTCEKVTEEYEYEKIKYVVLNNVKENHNTHLIAFQRIDGVKQTIPIGYHVKVYGSIDDQELIRCYTPVPCHFMQKYSQDYEAYRGDVCLLVKTYPEGLLSPTICNSVKGDVFEFSPPIGTFDMEKVANKSGYLFLAAGSGITPMLAIIKLILESTQMKCEQMYILYFNRTEDDIILRIHFDTLMRTDKRVVVKYVLSHPSTKWNGLTGHINMNLLKSAIDEQCMNTHLFPIDIFSLICGPLVFMNLAKSILLDIGYTEENIHVFGS